MTRCVDNTRLGRIGCGQTYFNEMQHCVAKVSWSEYPDGMAHITAPLKVIDLLWYDNTLRNPIDLGLEQNERGVWRKPLSESEKNRLKSLGNKQDVSSQFRLDLRSGSNPVPLSLPCGGKDQTP